MATNSKNNDFNTEFNNLSYSITTTTKIITIMDIQKSILYGDPVTDISLSCLVNASNNISLYTAFLLFVIYLFLCIKQLFN
jgi:hypothetical protein